MGRLSESSLLVMKNKSHAVTAQIVVPDDGACGVIIAQGGAFGGWVLYAKAYDGGGLGKGGDVTLYVDGGPVGAGRLDATVPMLFSGDETTDIGVDTVSDDYDGAFHGRVRWVQLDIDKAADDLDHLIRPEERLRVAMARQ